MVMARKRPSGKHKTPRTPVRLSETWHKLAQQLAAAEEKPTLWFIYKLLAAHAKERGVEHPPLPWSQDR